MHSILKKIIDHKLTEVESAKSSKSIDEIRAEAESGRSVRDFRGALQTPGEISLIAEVKKASPSKGVIREDFNPVEIARTYELAGASCISVLTDENFFPLCCCSIFLFLNVPNQTCKKSVFFVRKTFL